MDIELTDSTPIFKHPYKRSEVETAITEKMLDELKDAGLIEESTSPFSSPLLLVKKKDKKTHRLVIDYRDVNKNIKNQIFPMPHISTIVEALLKEGIQSNSP